MGIRDSPILLAAQMDATEALRRKSEAVVRRGRQALLFFSGLLCLAAVYVPLLLAGWATAMAIEALSRGQFHLSLSYLLAATICGMIWLLPIPVWCLVMLVHGSPPQAVPGTGPEPHSKGIAAGRR